jgi:hypothetical protein
MEKVYGRLSADQFRELIEFVPEMLSMLRSVNAHIASIPAVKFDSVMPGDYGLYSHVYELPFVQHLSLVVVALNRLEEIKTMAASPDPQEAVLEMIRNRDEVDDKPQHPDVDDEKVVTLAYSLGRSIQSMVSYGRSISSLLQDVRENNNHESLLKAIRMDRAVIGCPTAMKLIARAQIRDNKAFFKNLRSALAGPSKKEWAGLNQMRYALVLLREMGLNDLSETALEDLLVDKLKVYPSSQGNARKNLRPHYRQSQKIPSI